MKRIYVRDLRGPLHAATFAALPADARIAWRMPLGPKDLDRAADWLREHPAADLRLYGDAVAQIDALAARFVPTRVLLEAKGLPARLPVLPNVKDLTLEGTAPNLASQLRAFPALGILQADVRGGNFSFGALAAVPTLRALSLSNGNLEGLVPDEVRLSAVELRDVRVPDVDALLKRSTLRALRLRAIEGVRSVDALAYHANLRIVALEMLPYVDSLDVLATLPQLESLVLDGLWQFSIADAAVVATLHRLRYLAIDIGGRRKNVEIAKRLQTSKPPPFDIRERAYDLTIA